MAAAGAVNQQRRLWDGVLELTMAAQERGTDPLIWATELSSSLTAAGVSMPSVEVAELLVSHICWSNNIPIAWKFLEKALILRIVPPLFVLALLSTRIMESIDDILQFRQIFEVQSSEPGHLVVEFIFSVVWKLLDASLDDEGLLEHTLDKKSRWPIKSQNMEIDCCDGFEGKKMERQAALSKMNTLMAIELIGEFFQNTMTSRILYLARRNMPMHWDCFIQHLRLLTTNSSSLRNSKNISPEALLQLTSDTLKVLSRACKMSVVKPTHIPSAGICNGTFRTSLWLPIDLYLEDALDGSHLKITSVAETLTGLVKALQALNQTTWQDAFHGLWTAALRLVQRERNPIGGPDRSLDTCLCMLLSIVTLAVVNIVEDEEITVSLGKRREDLVSSLQQLDDFEELLTPPPLVSSLANQAAAKAMMFLSAGNLRHLIVEACIARNVLDTSAYLWPGYLKGRCNQIPIPINISGQMPELERMYEIAVTGTDEEKISAGIILCGASLWRGYAPFLNALLVGLSSADSGQIFSLLGLVPQLAAALMPICEVFGSSVPNMSWTLNTGEVISSHAVFSNAFVLLLKLWRFDQPPLNNVMGDGAPVGSHLTPEYLLLVHNSQLRKKNNRLPRFSYPSPTGPVFMDSFPNLKRWYRKHQECVSSTLSSLVPGNTVHPIVEALLSMMFRKINRGGELSTSTSSRSSSGGSSSASFGADERFKIPAFDILEAVPFAIDAALSACAHGRLSPRELTTGLKDLADFLPPSLVTIFSYYSAEVSRGLWKPAVMNGIDWPSPAGYLSMFEEQMKQFLAATGASSPVTLPLPMAALLSLTITYKLNRVGECYINLVGPAFGDLAIRSPWPCMSVIGALWAQKAKHWSNFLVFIAAQAVFNHNSDAIVQLLKICFTTALGLNSSLTSNGGGGVAALLGHGFVSQSAVSPGILYLRVHRAVRNVMLMTEEIVSILMHTVNDIIANSGLPQEEIKKLKKTKYGAKYGQISLAAAMNKVRIAASLGASFVWMAGGLNSIQFLFKEILPSWFICAHGSDPNNGQETGAMLGGYALAYFTHFCGLFAWGVDSASPAPKRRQEVIGKHLQFLASALDGKILLGCNNKATWRAYVTGYFSLMISCTPNWMLEVDVEVLKRISKGLKQWNEVKMGLALLGISGIAAMGAAVEMIIETET
ncbi:mediator of RNA polymerase ii transcription subunit 33a [Phtheirospermum japonicum]|uniref:Mediator of RNA polymerase ii transcription subunit 33a n=1 Tax=Phtheirospermum japonicum TaxID=374723 RepID=A0A830CI02_9LAMI|nr:mediator of RNA polymerase ii transcription subunit 33a [Phtheirospermum japonicum]